MELLGVEIKVKFNDQTFMKIDSQWYLVDGESYDLVADEDAVDELEFELSEIY
jgi:hypothetical protein